jgi:cell division protein FtsB
MEKAGQKSRLWLWLAAVVFLILQLKLWFGEGGIMAVHQIKASVAEQYQKNQELKQRNSVLEAEVLDLKTGKAAIEERARLDLGMIKQDETFYLITGKEITDAAHQQIVVPPETVEPR